MVLGGSGGPPRLGIVGGGGRSLLGQATHLLPHTPPSMGAGPPICCLTHHDAPQALRHHPWPQLAEGRAEVAQKVADAEAACKAGAAAQVRAAVG